MDHVRVSFTPVSARYGMYVNGCARFVTQLTVPIHGPLMASFRVPVRMRAFRAQDRASYSEAGGKTPFAAFLLGLFDMASFSFIRDRVWRSSACDCEALQSFHVERVVRLFDHDSMIRYYGHDSIPPKGNKVHRVAQVGHLGKHKRK